MGLAALIGLSLLPGTPPADAAPESSFLYITDFAADELVVLELVIRQRKVRVAQVHDAIPVGKGPLGIDAHADAADDDRPSLHPGSVPAGTVLVTNRKDDTVSRIDPVSRSVTATIPVGKRPRAVEITPDGELAFVANFGSNDVSVIDLASGSVVNTVDVGRRPSDLAIDPQGQFVAVANSRRRYLSRIDVETALDPAAAPGAATERIRIGCRATATDVVRYEYGDAGPLGELIRTETAGVCEQQDLVVWEFRDTVQGTGLERETHPAPVDVAGPEVCGVGCADGTVLAREPADSASAAAPDDRRYVLEVYDISRSGAEPVYISEALPRGYEPGKVLRVDGPDEIREQGDPLPDENAFYGIPLAAEETGAGAYMFIATSPRRAAVVWTDVVELPDSLEPHASTILHPPD